MVDHYYQPDPETQEVTRHYVDGASFVATGKPHPLGFWLRHPAALKIQDSTDQDGYVTVRVWLKAPLPPSEDVQYPREPLDRPADYSFYGGGRMNDAYWETHPDIDHAEVINFYGDDSLEDDGWNANIWLKVS